MAVFKVIIPSNIKLIRFHIPIFQKHDLPGAWHGTSIE